MENKIGKHAPVIQYQKSLPVLWHNEAKAELKCLQSDFVIVPIDKATKVHSESLDTYIWNGENFCLVKYFHLIFGTDKEDQLLGKYIINICTNIKFMV